MAVEVFQFWETQKRVPEGLENRRPQQSTKDQPTSLGPRIFSLENFRKLASFSAKQHVG